MLSIPKNLKHLFWSHDLDLLNLEKHKRYIITNVLNYGNLDNWRWLFSQYGKDSVMEVVRSIPARSLRPRVRHLVEVLFDVKLNYAPRSTNLQR